MKIVLNTEVTVFPLFHLGLFLQFEIKIIYIFVWPSVSLVKS